MKKLTVFVVAVTGLLMTMSIATAFYNSVIAQNFYVEGVWIELYPDEGSYVWFVYNNEEYELEPEETDYESLLTAVSTELEIAPEDLDQGFIEYFDYAYEEAVTASYE